MSGFKVSQRIDVQTEMLKLLDSKKLRNFVPVAVPEIQELRKQHSLGRSHSAPQKAVTSWATQVQGWTRGKTGAPTEEKIPVLLSRAQCNSVEAKMRLRISDSALSSLAAGRQRIDLIEKQIQCWRQEIETLPDSLPSKNLFK